jgi:phage repressor protein C with HTH and peptisase S24 domain
MPSAKSALQKARENKGMTREQLAAAANVSVSHLVKLERGERRVSVDWARRLAPHLDISAQAVLGMEPGGAPLDPSEAVRAAPEAQLPEPRAEGLPDIPVYGVASAGDDGAFTINMAEAPIDYLPRPMTLIRAQKVFAILIQGSSMEPLFRHGDAVFCQEGRPYGTQDPVLVQLEAERGVPPLAFVKVYMGGDDRELRLRQLNPPEDITVPRVQVRKVWRALHWRDLA